MEEKWIPELKKYSRGTPFILVGTQSDRRDVASVRSGRGVSQEEGIALARKLRAIEYAECSAKTRDGLRDVFVGAIMTSLNGSSNSSGQKNGKGKAKPVPSNNKKRSCIIG